MFTVARLGRCVRGAQFRGFTALVFPSRMAAEARSPDLGLSLEPARGRAAGAGSAGDSGVRRGVGPAVARSTVPSLEPKEARRVPDGDAAQRPPRAAAPQSCENFEAGGSEAGYSASACPSVVPQ